MGDIQNGVSILVRHKIDTEYNLGDRLEKDERQNISNLS
jgi:hypothetical protein